MALELADSAIRAKEPANSTSKASVTREELLRPLPRPSLRVLLSLIAIAGIYVWGIRGTHAEPEQLVRGVPNMIGFVSRLFPINLDWTAVAKLPVDIPLPFTINAVSATDTLDGDKELEQVQAELANAVPLDVAIESGQPMVDNTAPDAATAPDDAQSGSPAADIAPAVTAKPWVEWKPSTLNRVWAPAILPFVIETLQMAVIGTTLAIFLALPFGLLGARNTSPHPVVYQAIRLVMNVNRAVPELIVALIFVAAVGLGPFTGVLALAISSIGSLGRLYSEAIEQIDPQQVMAVRATGASGAQIFGFSVVPQVLPLATSYSLVYFEHNVRAATILGIVGAGGVGLALQKYIALFQFQELMGAVIVLCVVVTIIDRLSARVRQQLI